MKLNYAGLPKNEVNFFLGYKCNNNCLFCSEMMNKGKSDKTTAEVKHELLETRKKGILRIVFTGGEPTIRPDLAELISYSKSIGFEEIFIITNGRMLFYKEFARKLARAGLTHILFSLHGPTAEIHDYLTRSPGSFNQTVQGIKNMVELGSVLVENNAVITGKNYRYLPELAELLVKLKVGFYEFILVNPITVAYYSPEMFGELVPRISKIEKYVHRALDIGIKNGIWCTAEAIPLCRMQGYEKQVTELLMAPERVIIGPGRYVPDVNKSRKEKSKLKPEKCKECKYYNVCEGIWALYAEYYGTDELKPIPGKYLDKNSILTRD